jgi:ATP-dependent exoDNAse (exonuclease V) beta subunit
MEARLQNALCGFDEAPIFTIHGFCQRMLKDRAFESSLLFDIELVTDPSELLQEIADDFWRTHFYEAEPTMVNFALKNNCGPDRFVGLLRTFINYPLLEFLSQAEGRSLQSLSAELESGFQAAREVWLAERDKIKTCFGSGAKWCNRPYNSDAEIALLFEQLETCFSESETAFEALGCLASLCPAALEEKKSKRSSLPVPQHNCPRLPVQSNGKSAGTSPYRLCRRPLNSDLGHRRSGPDSAEVVGSAPWVNSFCYRYLILVRRSCFKLDRSDARGNDGQRGNPVRRHPLCAKNMAVA